MSIVSFVVKKSGIVIPFTEDFTGDINIPINSTIWLDRYTQTPATYNQVLLDGSGNAVMRYLNTGDKYSQFDSKFLLGGDFDIECKFSLPTIPNYNTSQFWFYSNIDGTHFYQIGREFHTGFLGHEIRAFAYNNGIVINSPVSYTGVNDIRLRLTRVGTAWTGYYWNGSSWTSLGTNSTIGTGNADIRVQHYSSNTSTPDWQTNVDYIKINSGTLVLP